MTDYKSIWIKWIAFLTMDAIFKEKMLQSFHREVVKGFEVIAKIGTEELEAKLREIPLFSEIKEDINKYLIDSVWAGYALFLIHEGINPEEKNLKDYEKTNALGDMWMQHYLKDQNKSLLEKIDPVICMLIEKQTQMNMNGLFFAYPTIQKEAYFQVSQIETFLNWSSHQGFIFGMVENRLKGVS